MPHQEPNASTREAAVRLGARFGLRFVPVPQVAEDERAPFSANVGLRHSSVLFGPSAGPGDIIHECGHVLFGLKGDQARWFPWEWRVALWLEVEDAWHRSNTYYSLGDCEFGELGRGEQDRRLFDLLIEAPLEVQLRVAQVSPSGNPGVHRHDGLSSCARAERLWKAATGLPPPAKKRGH